MAVKVCSAPPIASCLSFPWRVWAVREREATSGAETGRRPCSHDTPPSFSPLYVFRGLMDTIHIRLQTSYASRLTLVFTGTNLWNNVHIRDLTELYLLVLDKALVERATGTLTTAADPYERFYWGSVATHQWGNVAQELAKILYKKGVVDSDKALSVPANEVPASVASNSRTVANRGLKGGWKPHHPSLEDTLEEDVDGVLEQDGLKK